MSHFKYQSKYGSNSQFLQPLNYDAHVSIKKYSRYYLQKKSNKQGEMKTIPELIIHNNNRKIIQSSYCFFHYNAVFYFLFPDLLA